MVLPSIVWSHSSIVENSLWTLVLPGYIGMGQVSPLLSDLSCSVLVSTWTGGPQREFWVVCRGWQCLSLVLKVPWEINHKSSGTFDTHCFYTSFFFIEEAEIWFSPSCMLLSWACFYADPPPFSAFLEINIVSCLRHFIRGNGRCQGLNAWPFTSLSL